MSQTSIQWTQQTWNPVRGCTRISPGCQNCYAERQAGRFTSGSGPCGNGPFAGFVKHTDSSPRWTGKVELIPDMLDIPLRRRKPTTYFVNSMSDLFHESLPDEAIDRVFAVMALCPQHTFQVLTKRAERMRRYFRESCLPKYGPNVVAFEGAHARVHARMVSILPNVDAHALNRAASALEDIYPGEAGFIRRWPLPNVWLGVSVEDQQRADERIPHLLQTPAAVRFLSVEPLLEPVDIVYPKSLWPNGPDMCCSGTDCGCHGMPVEPPLCYGIDWAIIGGESGPGARACNIDWIRSLIAQCKQWNVAPFVKQVGAWVIQDGERRIKKDKKGGDMHEWPHDIRVREMPQVRSGVAV